MMNADAVASLSLAERLWIYLRERFPLGKTSVLLAVFSAASLSVSARLAGRGPPPATTFARGWAVVPAIFSAPCLRSKSSIARAICAGARSGQSRAA